MSFCGNSTAAHLVRVTCAQISPVYTHGRLSHHYILSSFLLTILCFPWSLDQIILYHAIKVGPRDVWYVFVVRHVWMCQKDPSNLTHTVCFDVSIYRPIGEPDVTNERITHLLKLDTFFHIHDARIMTHDECRPKWKADFRILGIPISDPTVLNCLYHFPEFPSMSFELQS